MKERLEIGLLLEEITAESYFPVRAQACSHLAIGLLE
jgi:hypothetical protein